MHFFFLLIIRKYLKQKKGKNKVSWIHSDEFGLCFYASLSFHNKFLTKEEFNFGIKQTKNFEGCTLKDFNSGLKSCKFLELEVFHIS